MKKLSFYLLIFSLLISSSGAFAALPLLAYLTEVAVPLAVRAAVRYYIRQAANDSGPALEVVVNTAKPYRVPSGWTAANDPIFQPIPPATTPQLTPTKYGFKYYGPLVDGYATRQEAFVAGIQAQGDIVCDVSTYSWRYYSPDGVNDCTANGNNYIRVTNGQCPVGYTSNSTICNLTNATLVSKPQDSICGITFNSAGWLLDSRDADCAGGVPNVTVSPTIITDTRTTSTTVTTTKNADGTITIKSFSPATDGSNVFIYDTVVLITDTLNNTTVKSYTTEIYDPMNPTVTSGSGVPSTVPFPTDLNKQETQIAILAQLSALNNSPSSITPTLSLDAYNYSPSEVVSSINLVGSDFNTTIALPWWSWAPTFSSVACEPFSGTIKGELLSIDLCYGVDIIRSIIGWVFGMFAGWTGFSLVFRK